MARSRIDALPLARLAAALALLAALAAGGWASLQSAQADGHFSPQLVLSVLDDADNIVPPGSEISIRADLRFSGSLDSGQTFNFGGINLRLTGDYYWTWDATDRRRLAVADRSTEVSPPPAPGRPELDFFSPTKADGTPVGATGLIAAAGLHKRTLLATSILGEAYVFDTWRKRQVAVITAPDTVDQTDTFGRTDAIMNSNRAAGNLAAGGAVWQESDDTAWLFLTSLRDDIDGTADVGSLYIYKVDWSVEPVTVELVKRLHPPRSEFSNVRTSTIPAVRYGSSLDLSTDGSTLAVGSQRMNHTGAVYLYQRPSGAGQSWGDIEYADGIKVSVAPIPPWGSASDSTTWPYSWLSGGTCPWWCQKVAQQIANGNGIAHFNFAFPDLSLSADGRVLAVSASTACHVTQRGTGNYNCTSISQTNQGLVWVFVAPRNPSDNSDAQRSWSHVPQVSGTLIPAGANASSFDPATHYSPGPPRRVTTENAVLRSRTGYAANVNWGERLVVSPDGLTVIVLEGGNGVAGVGGGGARNNLSSWSGTLYSRGGGRPFYNTNQPLQGVGAGGIVFNQAGDSLMIGWPFERPAINNADNNGGVVTFWNRGNNGWRGAGSRTGRPEGTTAGVRPPTDVTNSSFGVRPIWGLDYERYAISRPIRNQSGSTPSGFFLSRYHACLPEQVNGEAAQSCLVDVSNITIPEGTAGQTLTIQGELTFSVAGEADSARTVRSAPLEITIGTINEVAELRLGRATDTKGTTTTEDDALYPDTIGRGETTTLRLQVLSEHGKAAATNSVNVISLRTTAGSLSTTLGGGCRGGNGGQLCTIDGAALSTRNSANILVTLAYPSGRVTAASAAELNATVIANTGVAATAEPLSIRLTGPATALAIAEPGASLLNVDTTDSGLAQDDRDLLTLTVTATDENGSGVTAPSRSYVNRIKAPDGQLVPASQIAVLWPLRGGENCAVRPGGAPSTFALAGGGTRQQNLPHPVSDGTLQPDTLIPSARLASTIAGNFCVWQDNRWRAWETGAGGTDFTITPGDPFFFVREGERPVREPVLVDGQPQLRLNVNAAASAPLAAGQYTLEVRQAGLPWVSQTFQLVGGPAAVALDPNRVEIAPDSEFTVTATVSDADGNPVPDGTAVEWSEIASASGVTNVVQRSRTRVTANGQVAATYRAVAPGRVTVTARVGELTGVALVDVSAPPPPTMAALLSTTSANAYSAWTGATSVQVSDLLPSLEGISTISLWRTGRWLRYGVSGGQLIPGSSDFPIRPGDVLWLSD